MLFERGYAKTPPLTYVGAHLRPGPRKPAIATMQGDMTQACTGWSAGWCLHHSHSRRPRREKLCKSSCSKLTIPNSACDSAEHGAWYQYRWQKRGT